ncbi:MAG: cupin domain-containing protein [Halioglobus sp.]
MNNVFAGIPGDLPQELFECLAERDSVRIERIVSRGHTTGAEEWYDQEQSEWVLVLRGRATIAFSEKASVTLEEGDYVNIAAHERHRVEWTLPDKDTIWLAVHY